MPVPQVLWSTPKDVARVEEDNSSPALKSRSCYIASFGGADRLDSSPVIERGRKAVELLFELKQAIPTFVQNQNIPKHQGGFPFYPQNRLPTSPR